MNLDYNKQDAIPKPISNTTVSGSEYNQIAGSLMHTQNEAGLIADANDNTQITKAVNLLAAKAAMPSSTKVSLTPAASGDTYTATYSGYMCFDFSTAGAGAWISATVNGQDFVNLQQERTSYGGCIFVPCGKGDTVSCTYSGTITLNSVYIMKAKGEI